ncbi:MAG: SIS domain-containing protein [Rhodospirillales bacterium]|nr:SIS domain-containing protein [Rhodospirillales bacterium]
MTFPDKSYPSIADYCDAYLARLARAGASIDRDRLARACDLLDAAFARSAWLFVCGNGGSAAIANHLLCDVAKGVQTDTDVLPRVMSLSSNTEIVTAIANDIAFEDCFAYQLRTAARPGDVLMTISASGDSENIVRALDWAGANGLESIALTGFDGGRAAPLATVSLHVDGDNYGVIEDTHQSIMHMLAQYLRQAKMPDTLIPERRF